MPTVLAVLDGSSGDPDAGRRQIEACRFQTTTWTSSLGRAATRCRVETGAESSPAVRAHHSTASATPDLQDPFEGRLQPPSHEKPAGIVRSSALTGGVMSYRASFSSSWR